MNHKRALEKTTKKFTNLIDGKISGGHTVHEIISYYNDCLSDKKPSVRFKSNIERCFEEEEINQKLNDDRYLFGDEYF